MIVERNLLVSILKLTKNGSVLIEDVKKDSRLPLDSMTSLLEKFQNQDLFKINANNLEVHSENRLKIAVRAVSLGADIEAVSSFLGWQEFESIAATALKNNGYAVWQNLRFKHAARKWEIDVVGCRKPLIICLDCKDWHHGLSPSAIRRIVEAQVERARALADALPNVSTGIERAKWNQAKFVPAILALLPTRFKFCDGVPIVPVLQLQDFLNQLPLELESLKYFQKEFTHLSH
ncbi:MAG TPA: nuclease-related domain-containing protein [Candidatus Bathyarchaeia archaeon]|nr:nuclease-related domain-containing protein [Candidatus Bathyarchaeia archaeon]